MTVETLVSDSADASHISPMTITQGQEATSSIERYLAEITDPVLRENLAREIGGMQRQFGLVFERHHPEGIRLPKHTVKRGSKVVVNAVNAVNGVARKDSVFYRVHRLNKDAGTASIVDADGNQSEHEIASLTVAKEFGDVMYPGLRKLSEIRRGDPDAPVHTIINGENYHALEALQYTHAGKVDLIYIDPPYNTGNADWKYNDRYIDSNDGYKNSKWLSFMEKRLVIAKSLLSRSGMVFISIDDREHARLKLLCDQVFGVSNFVANFVWRTDGKFDNQAAVKSNHEYVLMYSSDAKSLTLGSVVDPNISPESKLHTNTIRNSIVKNGPKNPVSSIKLPTGFPAAFDAGVIAPKVGYWPQYSEPAHVKNGRLVNPVAITSGWANANLLRKFIADDFKEIVDSKGQNTRFQLTHTGAVENVKTRRADVQHILTVLYNLGSTEKSGNELKAMGLNFPYPKPVDLIKYLVSFALPDAVILDFFGGSGTTAEAVIRLNSEDGGTRQSILVTNNELSRADDTRLRSSGHAPGDFDFEALGVFNHVTKPRLETVVNGVRRDGSRYSDGLDANIAFFELTYLDEPDIVRGAAFDDLSGLFWLKAGGLGGTVELTAGAKTDGFAISVSGRTAVLLTPGRAQALAEKLATTEHDISHLFIVTDSEAQGDEATTYFPSGIIVERIYGSYLEAFQVNRKD